MKDQTIKAPNVLLFGGTIIFCDGAKIDGDLVHTSGTTFVNGSCVITGSYYITSSDRSNYGEGNLIMTEDNGYLLVYGDFKINTSYTLTSGYLTAGTLEVKGNFTQLQNDMYNSSYNFNASGRHKTILSGNGEQIVNFESPQYSGFNILVIKNSRAIRFTTEYRYNELDMYYTIDFVDGGRVIQVDNYHIGDEVTPPAPPTKEADNKAMYEFKGWDKEVTSCNGDATYTAIFEVTYIEYTVIFKDADGTVLSTNTYHYGDTVVPPPSPSKAADTTFTYTFDGWDKEVTSCNGDATYTAIFEVTYIEYTVIFKDADGTVLSTNTYHYGDTVVPPPSPSKAADTTFTYTFDGWDKEVVACDGDATYIATYTSIKITDNTQAEDFTASDTETTPPSDTSGDNTTDETKSGCGGSIGGISIVFICLTCLSIALLLKKKKYA